jgi:AmmeMemoRadiSam system protein B
MQVPGMRDNVYILLTIGDKLSKELDGYLSKATCLIKPLKAIKAIIGPHAGYTYSGPTAAWAYKYLQ